MKKKIIISVIVIAVIIVGVVAFQNKNNQAPTEKIKVGVILPLSGQYASIGESIKNSMNMSLSDLENKNVELIFEDDRFDSKTALSAYNKLQTVDNVDIVVGLMSSTLETIKPIINKTDELMLTVGNEATIEKDNVFEVIPWATALFKTLGQTVSGKYQNIAIVSASDWPLAEPNKKQFKEGFGNGKYVEVSISSNSDVRTEVTKMLSEKVDAYTLLLPVDQGVKFLNEVSRQARENRPQLICDANIELTIGDYLSKVSDKTVFDGCISTMIADTTSKEFTEKYKQNYNAEPNFLAVYGYDAVQLISKALGEEKKADWKKTLEDKNFVLLGASGKIAFDETGSRVLESETHIFKDGKFVKFEN
jgi:branched-chain amino acid transport system substrate-binding protein